MSRADRPTTKSPVKPWVSPRVHDLPPLTELTLQTGPGIPGGRVVQGARNALQNGGSTVF
jgi:hypothetical protein